MGFIIGTLKNHSMKDPFFFYRKTNHTCEEFTFYQVFLVELTADYISREELKKCQAQDSFDIAVDLAKTCSYLIHLWNWICFLVTFIVFQRIFVAPIEAWVNEVTGSIIAPNSTYKLNSYLFVET